MRKPTKLEKHNHFYPEYNLRKWSDVKRMVKVRRSKLVDQGLVTKRVYMLHCCGKVYFDTDCRWFRKDEFFLCRAKRELLPFFTERNVK